MNDQYSDPLIGHQLANFRLDRLLGRGGMGSVYYGWDVKLERPVAVKVIDARFKDQQTYARRFVQEARAIAGWEHPNILQIHYADEQDGLYYYAMEYVEGQNLGELITSYRDRGLLLPQADALRFTRVIGEALDYSHSKGIIHRDVKPANVLVADNGRVALTDFGLAMDVSLGSVGEVFGTPRYISPEQARNSSQATASSDLYSLGIMLYEMLTGTLPFDDPSPTTLALQHITMEPPPPSERNPGLSQQVEQVILKALSKEPAERYPSGKALSEALEQALTTPSAEALPLPVERKKGETRPTLPREPLETAVELGATKVVAESVEAGMERHRLAERVQRTLDQATPMEGDAFGVRPEQKPSNHRVMWAALAAAALLTICIIVVAGGWLLSRGASGPNQAESSPQVPQATQVGGGVQPGNGGKPTGSAPPGATPLPDDQLPTNPAGEGQFSLYYDDKSLYFVNHSGQDVPVAGFSFELLNANSEPLSTVEGRLWGRYYDNFRNGYCLVIIMFGNRNPIQPQECASRELVVRTPTREQDVFFWVGREGATEFRVLWQDQEIGRCPLNAGPCEVYLR